ncbi:sigma-70 family RNA polymerase sigma factor [Sphingobacterium sp. SRCM116780]|uniref:RNA polymerase sigma factor n=1 Tax=Sphingobacterium sp. SRCM116780 TaxID=2907623 RepID=UPI001F42067A|nr:sigma-70 family RNA polymerase sigma factor [Sphingobacterium sp. SRCM116780]UIR57822.1 sigma-70 family RNA polymerase sigma factor [Sphingobacterium sp. SRCM116780]
MTSRYVIEEEALLIKFQSGDRRALDKIFRIYHPALLFFANRLLINCDSANSQEVVLDTFFKVFERRESFVSFAGLKAFLYLSTKNACLNVIEKEKVRLKRLNKYTQDFEEFDDENILSRIVQTEVLRELRYAIELLPEQCRNVMQKLMEGKTAKEIAEELDITVSTVNSQKSRAVFLLKKSLSSSGMVFLLYYL